MIKEMISLVNAKPVEGDAKHLMVSAILSELENKENEGLRNDLKEQFLIQIIEKRISAFKLDIEFTTPGYLMTLALCDRPGAVVVLLIDCLQNRIKKVTASILSEMYPYGFYNDEAAVKRIDIIKERKVQYDELY